MATYPLYVESTDGKFYRDPCFKGDGWFINMIGNRNPEIVVIQPMKKSANEILDSFKIRFRNIQKTRSCRKRIENKLTPVVIYIFELTGPIPTPSIFASTLDKIQSGYTFYDFK
jgi:hypothetical protein